VNSGTIGISLNLVVSSAFLSKNLVVGFGGRYRYFHIFPATSPLVKASLFPLASVRL
jgi:hypothetical protein